MEVNEIYSDMDDAEAATKSKQKLVGDVEVGPHAAMGWESLVKSIRCSASWMKQEVGLILTTIFLIFLLRTICIAVSEADHPFFTVLSMTSRPASGPSINEHTPTDDEPAVEEPSEETFITGTEAVRRFRDHLQCFSDSGQWVYDPTPRHLPWNYVGDTFASTCEGRHLWPASDNVANEMAEDIALRGAPGNWSVREELKWVWQTNTSCPWRPVDREDFCRKVGPQGHMMLVGDSLNHEISWAVMNALVPNATGFEHLNSNIRKVPSPYEMCGDVLGEGNGFNVSFIRNDRLSPVDSDMIDTVNNFYEHAWLHLLDELGIKTLLLNRGAHYEDDEKYTTALRTIFTILSLQYPHIHVIYRTTQPGHMDCMNFTRPLDKPQEGIPLLYHWGEFNRQNMLAKTIVEEFHYTYMDVYPMLSLRADGHISYQDCLHYCLPGPLDIVVENLYNIYLLI